MGETKEELSKLHKEIAEGRAELEDKVTERVTGNLKPMGSEIQQQAKKDIQDAVQKEIAQVDIPSIIQKELQNAITNVSENDVKPEDIKAAIKEEFTNIDIPTLIKDEVNQAMRKTKKDAEKEVEEAAGEPGVGEP